MSGTLYSAHFTDATRPVPQAERVSTMQHLHRVALPEDVEAAFEAASPVDRMWAFLIDVSVILGALVLASMAMMPLMMGGGGMAMALGFLLWFTLNIGYFFIFEGLFAGQTPGKAALRLRVIRNDGEEIGPGAGITRAFMRFVVIGPVPALLWIGVFSPATMMMMAPFSFLGLMMFVDPRSRSLSDLVAGTMVVNQRVPRHEGNRPHVPLYFQLPQHQFPLNHLEMSKLTPADYVRLEEFGTRLSTINNASRQQAAIAAAAALATRMNYSRPVEPQYAEIFLFEMHAALKQQLQQLYPDLYQ